MRCTRISYMRESGTWHCGTKKLLPADVPRGSTGPYVLAQNFNITPPLFSPLLLPPFSPSLYSLLDHSQWAPPIPAATLRHSRLLGPDSVTLWLMRPYKDPNSKAS
ncbi:hypothetical protein FRC16_005713 [Serendipita sp. 398]|nr:hypothetical protein FRC16_005713 [Serendipita sp. 398]